MDTIGLYHGGISDLYLVVETFEENEQLQEEPTPLTHATGRWLATILTVIIASCNINNSLVLNIMPSADLLINLCLFLT